MTGGTVDGIGISELHLPDNIIVHIHLGDVGESCPCKQSPADKSVSIIKPLHTAHSGCKQIALRNRTAIAPCQGRNFIYLIKLKFFGIRTGRTVKIAIVKQRNVAVCNTPGVMLVRKFLRIILL